MNRRAFLLGTAACVTAVALPSVISKSAPVYLGMDLASGPDRSFVVCYTSTPGSKPGWFYNLWVEASDPQPIKWLETQERMDLWVSPKKLKWPAPALAEWRA